LTPLVYKVAAVHAWRVAEAAGAFAGSALDRRDGFIHLSTARQVRETAARHFAGATDLLLIAVAADGLDVRWEPSRGGDLFPHLYGELPMSSVVWTAELLLRPDGTHLFPPTLPVD
jgi:uncharacterized protein (DUF952 family)